MPEFSQLETLLEKYFPGKLSVTQISQFRIAFSAIMDWNEKVNLISRKDLENLHLAHSFCVLDLIWLENNEKTVFGGGFSVFYTW